MLTDRWLKNARILGKLYVSLEDTDQSLSNGWLQYARIAEKLYVPHTI